MELHYGNLLEMAKNGEFDVIIHGCNCYKTMGAGIAKYIKQDFPEAFEADQKTAYGDKNKLGNFSEVTVIRNGNTFVVINAYTQHRYGGGVDNFEYDTFPKLLTAIKEKYGDKRIGLPLIGCGLAGGDEPRILKMIKEQFEGVNYKLVEIDINKKLNLGNDMNNENTNNEQQEVKEEKKYTFFYNLTTPFSNFYPAKFEYKDLKFISSEQFMMYSKARTFKDFETANRIINIYNEFMIEPGVFKDTQQKLCFQFASSFAKGELSKEQILSTSENKEIWNTIQKKIKALGREVKNYDEKVWSERRASVVLFGVKLKFSQNEDIKQVLLNTDGTYLVEAAKFDSLSTMQHIIQKLKEEFSVENKIDNKLKM
jgi:ribA/ribD-fused uncharacterized protein